MTPVRDLPPALRRRIATMAGDAVGRLSTDEVPAAFRRLARFAPAARARHADPALLEGLDADPSFRQRTATVVRQRQSLAGAVDAGEPVDAADPLDVAALAWILRPDGWEALVDAAAQQTESALVSEGIDAATADEVERLRAEVRALKAEVRALEDKARQDATERRREVGDLRREVRDAGAARDAAVAELVDARTTSSRELTDADRRLKDAEAEARRLRRRLSDVETSLETVRRGAREGRSAADVRLRLLLDTVVDAAQGLRRELALPPVDVQPADEVVASGGAVVATAGAVGSRARSDDDPALLDELLRVPRVHLVVDGYNVTKLGYGGQTLEEQRDRLVNGLGPLAARTGAEVTVVFDGAAVDVRMGQPRAVRVLFSPPGHTADEVIRRLVRAEPQGRPLVVVSSDREVADGVRASGATPMASRALLRLLDR